MQKQYFKSPVYEIIKDVCNIRAQRHANILGIELLINPFVFPSDQFRTTNFLLKAIKNRVRGKRICDMGCGPGIVGLAALYEKAKGVVQIDINPYAVQNTRANRDYHCFDPDILKVYESDCFDKVPFQLFDLIIFNIPFHSDDVEIHEPIERAFIDPNFETLEKFLKQAPKYLSLGGEILIAFSNKGDIEAIERLFSKHKYLWKLTNLVNSQEDFDNRLYSLTLKK